MSTKNSQENPPDIRRGQGILDERHYRELSTDLHQMQLAYEGGGLGGHYALLAKHFSREDFFPPGDEKNRFSQFPNLTLFFFYLQMVASKDKVGLEKRITDWKKTRRFKSKSFSEFYDFVERAYGALGLR